MPHRLAAGFALLSALAGADSRAFGRKLYPFRAGDK